MGEIQCILEIYTTWGCSVICFAVSKNVRDFAMKLVWRGVDIHDLVHNIVKKEAL